MFMASEFNGDISDWDVFKVENMSGMFSSSQFNGNISQWDVSNVEQMQYMFSHSDFIRDLSMWKPYNLEDVNSMFQECSAIVPYWANNFTDSEVRGKAIDSYFLYNDLNKELNYNNTPAKKVKI
jgi:hypothetical protein